MNLRHLLLTIVLLTGGLNLQAQPLAQYDALAQDLGTLIWHRPGIATFHVRNTGNENLLIEDVRTDCGCTAVSWPEAPIAPGENGALSVTFDAGMLGRFCKHLAVRTNAAPEPVYLKIEGVVAMKQIDYSGDFSVHIGDIYLNTDVVEFDDVNRGEKPVRTIMLFNNGKKSYAPELMHLPKYLTMEAAPTVIRPGRVGRINLILHSDNLRDMGLTQTDIYLSRFPGDRVSKENEINVSATLLPPAELSAAQLETAPVAVLDSTYIDLGHMGNKKKLKGSLTLTNQGRSPLIIHTLQVYNPGLSVSIDSRKIKPGDSKKLKISINAHSKYFKGRRRILLITNDPRCPKLAIDVIIKK